MKTSSRALDLVAAAIALAWCAVGFAAWCVMGMMAWPAAGATAFAALRRRRDRLRLATMLRLSFALGCLRGGTATIRSTGAERLP